MKYRLLVAAEAGQDIAEALEWLGGRSAELPPRFELAIEESFAAVLERPAVYPIVHRDIRRALLHHFPYSVFFRVSNDVILVLGVVHQARHPSVWQRRSPN